MLLVLVQVGKLIGQMWREMSDEEKQPYIDEYEREKVVYTEQLKVYKNSSAYKRWMDAKTQGKNLASLCHGEDRGT